jgi:hypothetical protein
MGEALVAGQQEEQAKALAQLDAFWRGRWAIYIGMSNPILCRDQDPHRLGLLSANLKIK